MPNRWGLRNEIKMGSTYHALTSKIGQKLKNQKEEIKNIARSWLTPTLCEKGSEGIQELKNQRRQESLWSNERVAVEDKE